MKQKCYFHKDQTIEKFCILKQCTLPLCQQCLSIHEEEHQNRGICSKIISFDEAYSQANSSISHFLKENSAKLKAVKQQLNNDKKRVLEEVENYYRKSFQEIETKTAELGVIEEKYNKLKKGSIKTLIYYFSGDIDVEKSFQISASEPIYEGIKNWMLSLKVSQNQSKLQPIQTFRRIEEKQSSSTSQFESSTRKENGKLGSSSVQNFPNKKSEKNNLGGAQEPQQNAFSRNNNRPYINEQPSKTSHAPKQERAQQILQTFANEKQPSCVQPRPFGTESSDGDEEFYHSKTPQSPMLSHAPEKSHCHIEQNSNLNDNYQKSQIFSNKVYSQGVLGQRSQSVSKLSKTERHSQLQSLEKCSQAISKYQQQHLQNQEQFPSLKKRSDLNRTSQQSYQLENKRKVLTEEELNVAIPTPEDLSHRIQEKKQVRFADKENSSQMAMTGDEKGCELRHKSYSHHILPSSKKDNLYKPVDIKKQLMSPEQIREMLEKRIKERNFILADKKELGFGLTKPHLNLGSTQKTTKEYAQLSSNVKPYSGYGDSSRKSPYTWKEQDLIVDPAGYNTKESIINQIYRETKY